MMYLEALTFIGIVVTVVNTIVGIVGIVLSCIIIKKEHQKSNRHRQK